MLFLLFFSISILVAFLLLFREQTLGPLDFWELMSSLLVFFLLLIFLFLRKERQLFWKNLKEKPLRRSLLGIISALVLYGFFYLGSFWWLKIWPESQEAVNQVYKLNRYHSPWLLIIFLGGLIGPGEEILWRWFLQRRWGEWIGKRASFLVISFSYSLVHLTTGNYLLLLAALICGLYWGWLFCRKNSILLNVISHSLWDILIFVLWPIAK